MKILGMQLRNFRRFEDLRIDGISESAKLVLIVGQNGSGKSCIFDAILQWYRRETSLGMIGDEEYYRHSKEINFEWSNAIDIAIKDEERPEKGSLYMRTAHRFEYYHRDHSIIKPNPIFNELRSRRSSDDDHSLTDNFKRLSSYLLQQLYDEDNCNKTVSEMRKNAFSDIVESTEKVFDNIKLVPEIDVLRGDGFSFIVDGVDNVPFNNLSSGEKAAFSLLLDLHLKKKYHKSAVFCIDEIETHMHTRLQGRILSEVMRSMDPSSQLWVSTHSLGVMRAAQECERGDPGSVCVIDLDQIQGKHIGSISPSRISDISSKKLLSIALDDYSGRISPQFVFVCEGSEGSDLRRSGFDSVIFSKIKLSGNYDAIFISGGSHTQISETKNTIKKYPNGIVSGFGRNFYFRSR